MVPTIVAFPGKEKVFEAPKVSEGALDKEGDSEMHEESKIATNTEPEKNAEGHEEDRVQAEFERQTGDFLDDIVEDLRNKNAHVIDNKAMK